MSYVLVAQLEAEEGLDVEPTRECLCVSQRSAPTQLFGFQNMAGMGLPSGPGNRTFSLGCVLALGLGATGLSMCDHVFAVGKRAAGRPWRDGRDPNP